MTPGGRAATPLLRTAPGRSAVPGPSCVVGRSRGCRGLSPGTYSDGVAVLYNLDFYVLRVLWLVGIPVGLYAFVHALMQRSDAFTAADKLTKPVWCAITGVGLAILAISTSGPYSILWLVGIIAVLIYIVDVRPRVIEIQQGPRW